MKPGQSVYYRDPDRQNPLNKGVLTLNLETLESWSCCYYVKYPDKDFSSKFMLTRLLKHPDFNEFGKVVLINSRVYKEKSGRIDFHQKLMWKFLNEVNSTKVFEIVQVDAPKGLENLASVVLSHKKKMQQATNEAIQDYHQAQIDTIYTYALGIDELQGVDPVTLRPTGMKLAKQLMAECEAELFAVDEETEDEY